MKVISLTHKIQLLLLALLLSSMHLTVSAKPIIKTKPVKHLFDIRSANGIKLSLPSDVMAQGNKIYIVDGDNHRIVVFNTQGELLFSFGSKGKKNGQFFYPVGIFVTKDENIYVADTKNYRIQQFSANGKHIKTIASISGKLGSKKVRPVDLAVNEKTKDIYVTTKHHVIVVYNKDGKKIREWGGNGKEQGLFRYPGSIIPMSDGRVAVVDILNTRVQVFRNKGKFSFQVSGFGVRPGFLIRPKGLAISHKENIYISDSYMDVIQVFSASGKFLYVLGTGGKPRRFISASGIAIAKNKLFVTETFDNKVAVYQLLSQ